MRSTRYALALDDLNTADALAAILGRVYTHTHLTALGAVIECQTPMQSTMRVYEVRPRKDKRGIDLISDALPFGGLWYSGPNAISNAIGYAQHRSRSHNAVIRLYDAAAR